MGKILTLGEIMLRLSTQVGMSIKRTRQFQAQYGGGEANVAISLSNFGHEVSFVSKVPDNNLGQAVKSHLNSFGVDTDFLLFGGKRLGVYYLDQGIGPRGSKVIYDRSDSSFSQMATIEWDLDKLFDNCELLHLSGITPALSEKWQELLILLVRHAKAIGVPVSYDSNFRAKLWSQEEAGIFLKKVLPYVDYLSASKLDAIYLLGIKEKNSVNDSYYFQQIHQIYPNIRVVYATKRKSFSASENDLQGMLWSGGEFVQSKIYRISPIVDRVGGGDAFAAGILHGILCQWKIQQIVEFGTAASVLKHSYFGDCNDVSEQEVKEFIVNGVGLINR